MCLQVNALTFNSSKKYAKKHSMHARTHSSSNSDDDDDRTAGWTYNSTVPPTTNAHRKNTTKCAIYSPLSDRIYINIFMDFSLAF